MHTADSTRERDLDFCRAMTVWASVLLALGRAEGLAQFWPSTGGVRTYLNSPIVQVDW